MKNFYIKNKINRIILFLVLSFFVFVFSSSSCLAVNVDLESDFSEINLNNKFKVDLILSSEVGEIINAIEGVVNFDSNLIKLEEIRDGNSVINFWVEKPRSSDNQVVFSGIIPGGYHGLPGPVFSLVFTTVNLGSGQISLDDLRVLLHDGLGSEVGSDKLIKSNFNFLVTSNDSLPFVPVEEIEDPFSPENFIPVISQDVNIFDNKFILIFSTQDKGSGVDYYLVKESPSFVFSFLYKWEKTESPYVLKDQNLSSYIYVKAVDKNGNKRLAFLTPENKLIFYKSYDFWFVIFVSLIILGSAVYLFKKRRFF
jgi:hypothetical protein